MTEPNTARTDAALAQMVEAITRLVPAAADRAELMTAAAALAMAVQRESGDHALAAFDAALRKAGMR